VASSIYLYCVDVPCLLIEGEDHGCRRKWNQISRKMFALKSYVVALAFGALLFLTHWLFGELSIVELLISGQSSSAPILFLEG